MEEQYIRNEFTAKDHARLNIETLAKTQSWVTADGKRMKIEDMSDSHIKSAVNMLERKGSKELFMPLIWELKKELKRRNVN